MRTNLPFYLERLHSRYFSVSYVLIFLLCSGATAQQFEVGTSPNPVGSGARALGMGNAFTAVADDATAASWNPAGALQLEVPELSFALAANSIHERIHSDSNPEVNSSKTFSLLDFNYASLVLPFTYGKNMVFSLNYLTLFRFEKELEFPIFSPGQSTLDIDFRLDQEGSLSAWAPAFGIAISDHLFLGLTINVWDHSLTQSSAYEKTEISNTTSSFGMAQVQANFLIKNRFEVESGTSLVLGALYRLSERLNIGVVIKPEYELDIDHIRTESVVLPNSNSDPETIQEKTNAEFDFPWVIGVGMAWRQNKALTIATDFTWTTWSDYTFSENGRVTNPVSGRPIGEGRLKDTYTVRVGCEWLHITEDFIFPLRAGVGLDQSPTTKGADNFYTTSVGSGIQVGDYNFDIAYQFRWGNSVNSDILQGIVASEDIREHRVLASLIYYY